MEKVLALTALLLSGHAACSSSHSSVDELGKAVQAAVSIGDERALLDLYPDEDLFSEICADTADSRSLQLRVAYARAAIDGRFAHVKNPAYPEVCRRIPNRASEFARVTGGEEFPASIDRGVVHLDDCERDVTDLGHIRVEAAGVKVLFDAVKVDARFYVLDRVGCYPQ